MCVRACVRARSDLSGFVFTFVWVFVFLAGVSQRICIRRESAMVPEAGTLCSITPVARQDLIDPGLISANVREAYS